VNDEGRPERRPLTDADQRRATLARQRNAATKVRRLEEHRRVCRELEQLASLVEYYRQPKGAFYCTVVEGRAA
jgi:hypothetical protein